MEKIIELGINLSAIKADQKRMLSEGKITKSKKGEFWLSAVAIKTNGEYSDYIIVEKSTKEERDNKVQHGIIGNATIPKYEKKEEKEDDKNEDPFEDKEEEEDDLPF